MFGRININTGTWPAAGHHGIEDPCYCTPQSTQFRARLLWAISRVPAKHEGDLIKDLYP